MWGRVCVCVGFLWKVPPKHHVYACLSGHGGVGGGAGGGRGSKNHQPNAKGIHTRTHTPRCGGWWWGWWGSAPRARVGSQNKQTTVGKCKRVPSKHLILSQPVLSNCLSCVYNKNKNMKQWCSKCQTNVCLKPVSRQWGWGSV